MDIEEQYDKIYRFCYFRVGNRVIAEDLTQETFLRFLNSPYQEQGKGIRYLYTIARNLCIEESRKIKWEVLPEDVHDEGAETSRIIEEIIVKEALRKMPEDDREILIMRYMNEESLGDISRITGLSRFALYRKLRNSRKMFEELMEGDTRDE